MNRTPVDMIDIVAEGLGNLLDKVVFFGGAVSSHRGRGNNDYFFSHDIEDVVTVIDGRVDFTELNQTDDNVKDYLREEFAKMVNDDRFRETVMGYIGYPRVP